MNVIDKIVANDWCIGCGLCVVSCPSKNLTIENNNKGEYSPVESDKCIDGCNICLKVCPFNDEFENQDDISKSLYGKEDDMNYDNILGYYRNAYVGHSINNEYRDIGSSGGITTLLFDRLIESGEVDGIVAVCKSEDDALFKYSIIEDRKKLNEQSGSKYYPVEMSEVLNLIKDSDKKYAVIALPCMAFSLRKSMKINKKLRENIKYIFSVACGQLQNKYYSEMISLKSGISLEKLKTIDYRRKGLSDNSINYATIAIDKNGIEGNPHFNLDLPNYLWNNGYFMQNSCNICDDVFGEVADITFMDAWLDKYFNDLNGTSIVLVRNKKLESILIDLRNEKKCSVSIIEKEKVKTSQTGIINKKRVDIAGRLYYYNESKVWVPKRRIKASKENYLINKRKIKLKKIIQEKSKQIWSECSDEEKLNDFYRNFKKYKYLINANDLVTKVEMKLKRFIK